MLLLIRDAVDVALGEASPSTGWAAPRAFPPGAGVATLLEGQAPAESDTVDLPEPVGSLADRRRRLAQAGASAAEGLPPLPSDEPPALPAEGKESYYGGYGDDDYRWAGCMLSGCLPQLPAGPLTERAAAPLAASAHAAPRAAPTLAPCRPAAPAATRKTLLTTAPCMTGCLTARTR